MRIKTHFHINGFAFRLALEKRLGSTRKWSIANIASAMGGGGRVKSALARARL